MATTRFPSWGPGQQAYQLNEAVLQQRAFYVPSAECLTLNASPVEVVPAPGAGKLIEFVSAVLMLDYGSATYASNGICNFILGATAGSGIVSDSVTLANFFGKTADSYVYVQALSEETVTTSTNTKLSFACNTGEMTTGDSVVRGIVTYRVVDFSKIGPNNPF